MKINTQVPKHTNVMTQIDEFLFLGNIGDARNLPLLAQNNIKHILQLVPVQVIPELEGNIRYLRVNVRGGKNTNIQPVLESGLNFIHSSVRMNENVLVHCLHGENRSASVVIAYLMAVKNLKLYEAEAYVKSKRSISIKQNTKHLLNTFGIEGLRKMISD